MISPECPPILCAPESSWAPLSPGLKFVCLGEMGNCKCTEGKLYTRNYHQGLFNEQEHCCEMSLLRERGRERGWLCLKGRGERGVERVFGRLLTPPSHFLYPEGE